MKKYSSVNDGKRYSVLLAKKTAARLNNNVTNRAEYLWDHPTPWLDLTTTKNNTDFTQRTFQRESLGGETRAKEEKKNEPNNRRRLFHSTGTPLQTRSRPLNVFICSTSNLLVEKKKDFESISRTPYSSSKNDTLKHRVRNDFENVSLIFQGRIIM